MVLVGTMPFQNGVAQFPGRASSGASEFFLVRNVQPPHGLASAAPQEAWLDIANNMTAEFRLDGFFGLYEHSGGFSLEMSITSLNRSGLSLSFSLLADISGDGVQEAAVLFHNYTTSVALQTEHPSLDAVNVTGALGDFCNGTLRLLVNRTDQYDGLLRLHCGAGGNASKLLIPYGAPLKAFAGGDLNTKIGRTVDFNASSSRTVDPVRTLYIWDFDSSNGLGTDATGVKASHAFPAAGTYNVTLTLRLDSFVSYDTLRVNVSANVPPVADAGLDVVRGRVGILIVFHGSGSDPDGTVVSYNWSFGDGVNASGKNVTHAYNSSGNFTARLTVWDNDGASAYDHLSLRINYPPQILGLDYPASGNRVSFRVTAADPDADDILSYRWEFGDGTISNSSQPVHTYGKSGTYAVRCTVFDSWGDNDTKIINITITDLPPVIASLGVKSTSEPGEKIYFRPSVYDPEHGNLTYLWDFGDGRSSTDPEPTHTYSTAGTYRVTLSVSDGSSTTTSSATIKVATATGVPIDSSTALGFACLAVIGVIVVAALVWGISRTRPTQAPHPYYDAYQAPPPGAPYFGGPPVAPYPGFGAPEPLRQAPTRAHTAPRMAGPPGACPRCGSGDLTVFGDGHSKCNQCRKIIYTG
jgi:PKD repeat protein